MVSTCMILCLGVRQFYDQDPEPLEVVTRCRGVRQQFYDQNPEPLKAVNKAKARITGHYPTLYKLIRIWFKF